MIGAHPSEVQDRIKAHRNGRDLPSIIEDGWHDGLGIRQVVIACNRHGHRVTAEQVQLAFAAISARLA